MRTYSKQKVIDDMRAKICIDFDQNDLARELGFSSAFISGVLRGKDNISLKLADRLGFEKLPDRYIRKQ